jgi:hypothetical protein
MCPPPPVPGNGEVIEATVGPNNQPTVTMAANVRLGLQMPSRVYVHHEDLRTW